MSSKSLKLKLICSSALLGAALMAPAAPAHAITVNAGSSPAVDLGVGVGLIVTSTGTIAGSTHAVTFSGIATSIDNSGTITSTAGEAIFMNNDTMSGGITNSGTIAYNGGAGIYLESGSEIGGGVTNSGTLSGNPGAIVVSYTSTISGTVTNSGTIRSNNTRAIIVFSGGLIDGDIVNSGLINAPGGSGSGIYVNSGGTVDGAIRNSGTINGNVEGVYFGDGTGVNPSSLSGGITNTGSITGGANGVVLYNSDIQGGLTNSGRISGAGQHGVFLTRADVTGTLTNSGTIQGSFDGIYLNSHSTLTGNVANSGTITGDGYGFEMAGDSTLDGYLTNSGTIASSSYRGVNIQSSHITGIINSGHIAGGSTSNGQYGLNISGSSYITGGITNSGTISGYSGLRIWQAASTADFSGGITNSGTITGQNGGNAVALEDLQTNISLVLDGGRIIGNVVDNDTSNGFSNVIVADDFTTEGDFGVSTLTVDATKELIISAGDTFTTYSDATINGILTFEVDTTANFGALVISNGAADITNATITISAASATLASGDVIKIIDGSSALIGGPGSTATTVSDTSLLWDFKIVDGLGLSTPQSNQDLFLLVQGISTASDVASTPNNVAVANVIESLSGSSDPILQQITANLNGASNAEEINDILESTTPGVDESILTTAKIVAGKTSDLIQSRLSDLSLGTSTGVSSGNLTNGLSAWGQAYGQHASQDERDGIDGYDANTYGFVFGVDSRNIIDNAVIGLAISYGDTSVKSKDVNDTRTDINSYQIGLYGDYELAPSVFINGNVAYGYNDIDSTRHDVGGIAGVNANADTSADQYTAHVEFGKHFKVKEAGAPTITPTLLANYLHLSQDSYTETGAGGANLDVTPDDINALELGAAVKAKWELKQTDGSIIAPALHAGYRYDVIGDTVTATSSFTGGGAAFDTQGADPARHIINTGAGLSYSMTNDWTVSATYDFEYKEDYTAHSGIVRAGYKF